MNLSAFFGMMATLWLLCGRCETAPEVASNAYRRFHSRPLPHGYPLEELLNEDEDIMELNKRQQFDDYGHMRFGKRDQFDDDYGHMRFGRGHE